VHYLHNDPLLVGEAGNPISFPSIGVMHASPSDILIETIQGRWNLDFKAKSRGLTLIVCKCCRSPSTLWAILQEEAQRSARHSHDSNQYCSFPCAVIIFTPHLAPASPIQCCLIGDPPVPRVLQFSQISLSPSPRSTTHRVFSQEGYIRTMKDPLRTSCFIPTSSPSSIRFRLQSLPSP
jgi:hypothetical protein